MMDGETNNKHKHERSRTRWTQDLDMIFVDLVVKQIQLGNSPNNVFDKKTWNQIRDEFNKQTSLNFNNNQLRKHLDVLRTRFYNLKSASAQHDFVLDDPCGTGFDFWEDFGTQARPQRINVKDCPIYEQLRTIFTDTSTVGKYAQSSHFDGFDKLVRNDTAAGLSSCTDHSENPSSSRSAQENTLSSDKVVKNVSERKRKRPASTHFYLGQDGRDQEINEALAEALLDMLAASKCRTTSSKQSDETFSITNCIKALDELQGIDLQLYYASLDLFEDPNVRETFLSLKGDMIRLAWLQCRFGRPTVAFCV